MRRLRGVWPEVKHGLRVVNGLLPAVAVLLGLVAIWVLGNIIGTQHDSNIESCERTNESRVVSIEEKRGDVKNLRSDRHTQETELALWEAVLKVSPPDQESPAPVVTAFNDNLEALRGGVKRKSQAIHRKRRSIHESIAAQADVAIEPGSPVVDCDRAFP